MVALLGLALCGAATPSPPKAAAAPVAATGSLTGTVLDSLKKEPVAYATVVLLPPAPDDKPITGVAADDAGKFTLTKLAAGSFRLRASYVGYGTHTRAVTVRAGATDVGTFRLPAAATALAEAVVIGTKPVVEVRPDRLVYNADQDVTNAGGTAADVLRKAPLLAVDGDGNVKMRGSGNFRVLVNNKPSPTLAANLAEALKSIPADQIQSVEVITTPPAKYDGEGTAGIINIVLKKGVQQSLNGRVGVSSGNRNTNGNASLNFRKGKFGFTSSGSVGRWYNPGELSLDRTGLDGSGRHQRAGPAAAPTTTRRLVLRHGGPRLRPRRAPQLFAGRLGERLRAATTTSSLLNRFTAPDASQNHLFTRDNLQPVHAASTPRLPAPTPAPLPRPAASGACWGSTPTTATLSGYDFDQYANSTVPLDRRAGQLPRTQPATAARATKSRPRPILCSPSAKSKPWKRA